MLQNYVTRDRHFIFFLISTLPNPHNYHQYQHQFDDRSNDYVNIHLRDERTSPLKIIDLS